jgi:hypothetical protein
MPVMPTTQEAEIRRIMVQSQPREIGRPYLGKKNDKKGWWNGSRCRP